MKRINLQLSDEDHARLKLTKERVRASSDSEVARRAIRLIDMVSQVQAQGGNIVVRRPDQEDEVLRVVF